ncbi:hypothetical protein [Enterobacter kobei]|uniref:hypothetical protein n=1 Tax=Enterobacter kobei TaxID=208224 RepID=UPI002148E7A5|nr:hypothetical protein [Enterobacter kobei]MCR1298410.1 hypothetical protein [Enterobacter kobei]
MTNNNLTDERLSALIRVARDSLELYEMELPVIDDVMIALAELQQRRSAMLQGDDGNSPVIPDGWALVPVEPTEHMIVEGFESEPDEFFSDEEVWEAYDAMSGCQQAAHWAKLCWAAMIKAAPKLE